MLEAYNDNYSSTVTYLSGVTRKNRRHMIKFQSKTSKVLKQAKQSHGMVDYAVKSDFPKSISGHA
ncbi:MAG: hypothetical protein ACJ71D_01685 [Nitrososphaera sp.]